VNWPKAKAAEKNTKAAATELTMMIESKGMMGSPVSSTLAEQRFSALIQVN
jgi:hypothetical protein